MAKFADHKKIEFAFITIFSVLILVGFYFVISMNGVVLGNDPAVHLEKSRIFLNTGQIPLSNLGWTPPLYEIVLAMFIAFSGANDIGQLIFLVKAFTVVVNWLMFMAVYLLASRFFNKKVGVAASILLLLCFPVFELNQWGGYTSVLGIAFLLLLLLYLPLSVEKFGYLVVTFFVAFSVVLTHQLTTFIAVLILPPVLIYMLAKSRGASLKVLIVLVLGGGIAFFVYYFRAMIDHVGILIEHLFFSQKNYIYQIEATSLNAYVVNFGFIILLGVAGFYFAFRTLRATKRMAFFAVLLLSLLVPFILAQSYIFGLLLPFQWFIYYLTPPLAIFSAVTVVYFAQKAPVFYVHHRASFRKKWVKAATVALIGLVCVLAVVRADTVYGKIMEAGTFYSTTDVKAYDAGIWLRDNYHDNATVVVTEVPGFWFQEFSDKMVIAQTNPIIERNLIAESVLTLSYEMENPQVLVKAYQAKGDISDENYVSIDHVWNRVSYGSASGDFVNYTQDGVVHKVWLNSLAKQITVVNQTSPRIEFAYSNENITVTETVTMQNNTYPTNVSWSITSQKGDITDITLYLSTFFDLKWSFNKAQIPQLLNWVNPWDAPAPIGSTHGTGSNPEDWAVATFTGADLKDGYLGLYDDQNNIGFAFNFTDAPDWGNIGALANRRIDAVRFQYQFSSLGVNESVSWSYQMVGLSKNSYLTLEPSKLQGIFDQQVPAFKVATRDFRGYIEDANINIGFIVYDRNQLDTQIINSKLLQLIYSNDRYAIFKVLKQPS